MVRRLSGLMSSKCVGAWMLKVPRTMPSRWTMRLGGGSSTGAAAGVEAGSTGAAFVASVGGEVAAGKSLGVGTGAVYATVVGAGAASATVVGAGAGGSCLRYWAATKA